jgi:hypothetical protein
MKYIKKNFFLSVSIVFIQLFFSLLFVSSNALTITSKLLYYKQYTIDRNYEDSFVNVEVTNPDKKISDTFAQFISNNVSRGKNVVTYYSVYDENNSAVTISSEQNSRSFELTTSLLYNPFRYDMGNKYFESFRLRQHFQDVDSRYLKPGYDFNLQLSSDKADLLLSTLGFNRDYTIFKENLIDFKLNLQGIDYLGYISNVFYIDEDEPIALHLQNYYTNFSTIIVSSNIRSSANFSLNHSFVNSSMRIKQEFEKISMLKMDDGVVIKDSIGHNNILDSVYSSIVKPNLIDYKILAIGLIGLSFSVAIFVFILFKRKSLASFNKKQLASTIFISAILFSLFLFLGRALFNNEFLYRLSNIYSGAFTLVLIAISLIMFYVGFKENKKVIYE